MRGERLSDRDLDDIEASARAENRSFGWITGKEALAMIAELRERRHHDEQYHRTLNELIERRKADLASEDVEALRSLRATVELEGRYGSKANRALAVIDKLLTGKDGGRE